MAAQAQQEQAKSGAAIATFYQRDPQRVLPQLSDGWPAFAVADRREPARRLMALRVRPGLPPRAHIVDCNPEIQIPNVLMPVAAGPGPDAAGQPGWFILCPVPPGPSLGLGGAPVREPELISCVLLPAAAALEALRQHGMTHRAIRPDNLFRPAPGEPVTLGPFWAAPPGTGQPPVADPPFLAWCGPSCQGDGCIADDVFALGVTLLALSMGRWPLAGVDRKEILHRTMINGSFATLTDGAPNLPPLLGDLLRGMLAEDPDHRPSPALLLDPLRAAARRTTTRPPRRAQRPIAIGAATARTARELAYALATQPEAGSVLLRNGGLDSWLRRNLSEPLLAGKLEENQTRLATVGGAGGLVAPLLLMQAIVTLEPLAPVVWRGEALWPDAVGPALAAAEPARAATLRELVEEDVLTQWIAHHTRRADAAAMIQLARDWAGWLSTRGASGGMNRLLYGLNPLLFCASPLLGGRLVARLNELLPALEAASAKADRRVPPIDPTMVAFIAARAGQAMRAELSGLNSAGGEAERPLILRLFARLQTRLDAGPLPGLAAWLHESGLTGLDRWHSKIARAAMARRVATLVTAGQLGPLIAAVEDAAALAADAVGASAAAIRIADLRQRLDNSEKNAAWRVAEARRMAQDIASGAGLLALLAAVSRLAFG